jgi:phosphoribosylformylglycinamidine synthase
MAQVRTLVITGYGTNCERECAFAADQAGSDQTTVVHFSDLTADKVRLADFNFLILPGGFLDGDDLGSAQAAALRWRHMKTGSGRSLMDELKSFLDAGGLILASATASSSWSSWACCPPWTAPTSPAKYRSATTIRPSTKTAG